MENPSSNGNKFSSIGLRRMELWKYLWIGSFCRGIASRGKKTCPISSGAIYVRLWFIQRRKRSGGRVARRSIVGFIGRNRLKGGPKVLPRMTDNRTLNWIFFSQTAWPFEIRNCGWKHPKRWFERRNWCISRGLILVGQPLSVF